MREVQVITQECGTCRYYSEQRALGAVIRFTWGGYKVVTTRPDWQTWIDRVNAANGNRPVMDQIWADFTAGAQ